MELVNFGKEVLQSAAEQAASYKLGQTVLRQVDRALWVVEKSARWAVPPPLDQDERPPPELVRPLSWVFFLAMLAALRVTRECISLLNLVMGKPPLRPADVVMYLQSKRRYLRTLKYQGNRMMRARTSSAQPLSWYSQIQSFVRFTICLGPTRYSNARGEDNSIMMINHNHRREMEDITAAAKNAERYMDKLMEKMMTDLNAESDDDNDSFTLTNANSTKSSSESEQDTAYSTDVSTTNSGGVATSTPQKQNASADEKLADDEKNLNNNTVTDKINTSENTNEVTKTAGTIDPEISKESPDKNGETISDDGTGQKILSLKEQSQNFIQNEANIKTQPQKKSKIANGRARKTSATKNREYARQ